jgi:DNA repair protein RadA/Sms
MSRKKTGYVCQSCGSIFSKWAGRCGECGEWNCIQEELIESKNSPAVKFKENITFQDLASEDHDYARAVTDINELDRVLGGGLVKGSAVLIGGDPGIGKSTLLIQLAAKLSVKMNKVVYISGEESIHQIRLRAHRLGLANANVKLLAETKLEDIISLLTKEGDVEFVIIDSVQTISSDSFNSAPGTVTQVRACSNELINFAKANGQILMLVGHVTKDGQIAGPKILEHMVDTVLYFEGDRGNQFRILRAVKNRFGGINEIGVFEMRDCGLTEVSNPSELFISPLERSISGSSIFAGIEGTRPILVEVQGLVAKSFIPTPRRSAIGWDSNRLSMLIAVLQVRYGVNISDKEIYLNIAGGLKISDPAADLAVICSLLSAATRKPLPKKTIVFGEVGLSGEVRRVSHCEIRLKEARKLGFENAIIPANAEKGDIKMNFIEVSHIKQLEDIFGKTPVTENIG